MDRYRLELRLAQIYAADPENRKALKLCRRLRRDRERAIRASGLSKAAQWDRIKRERYYDDVEPDYVPAPLPTPTGSQLLDRTPHGVSPLQAEQRYAATIKRLTKIKTVLGDGGTIMAFDGEWPYQGKQRLIDEIGISMYSRSAGRRDFNVLIRYPDRPVRRSRHDENLVLTPEEFKHFFAHLWEQTTILLGHDLKEDRVKMQKLGVSLEHSFYVDTFSISRGYFPTETRHRLTDLVQRCGVEMRGSAHVAIYDAQAVLDCVLKLVDALDGDVGDPLPARDLVQDTEPG